MREKAILLERSIKAELEAIAAIYADIGRPTVDENTPTDEPQSTPRAQRE